MKQQFDLWSLLVLCLLQRLGACDQLQIINGDSHNVCPGSILTLECTINGGNSSATVWMGTAFNDCGNNEIILLHRRFKNGTTGECNSGAIIGQSMTVENKTDGCLYVSQLDIIFKSEMTGKDIQCIHDNGSNTALIGTIKLNNLTSVSVSCTSISGNLNHPNVTLTAGSQDSKLSIIISGAFVLLFIFLLSIVPFLLYGLRKKLQSSMVCDKDKRICTPRDISHRQVINDENYTDTIKTFDNEIMGIYNCLSDKSCYNREVQKADDIVKGETPVCDLNSLVYTLRGQVSSKWYSFGLAIGIPKQILEQLKHYPDEECLVEVLDYWLKHHPSEPTWQEVMEAKKSICCDTEF